MGNRKHDASRGPGPDLLGRPGLAQPAQRRILASLEHGSAAPRAAKAAPPQAGDKRDVVVNKESESTESLLRRCAQLGFLEGLLCRRRICSERSERDPACHQ